MTYFPTINCCIKIKYDRHSHGIKKSLTFNSIDMVLSKGCVVLTIVFFISTANCIIDGFDALPYQLPYQAFIDVYRQQSNIHSCSGAIINEKFVITSCECVTLGDRFRIILGSVNPTKVGDHSSYDHETTIKFEEERIALLKVDKPINFDFNVQPVTLPAHNNGSIYVRSDPSPNLCSVDYTGTASGYLKLNNFHLQNLKMAVVPADYCSLFFPVNLLTTTLCVRGITPYDNLPSGSLCSEKGVPLVLPFNRTLIGIFEYTKNTCESGAAHLFIKIDRLVGWIEETISKH